MQEDIIRDMATEEGIRERGTALLPTERHRRMAMHRNMAMLRNTATRLDLPVDMVHRWALRVASERRQGRQVVMGMSESGEKGM